MAIMATAFGQEFELVTNKDVEIILKEVEKLFGDEMVEKKVGKDIFSTIVTHLKNFKTTLNNHERLYRGVLKSTEQTKFTHYKTLKQIQATSFGKALLDDLEQGYILLQGIRKILLSEEINYRFVKEYADQKRTVRAFSLNLEELIFLTRKRTFSGYTEDVAALSMTIRGLVKGLKDEIKQNLTVEKLTEDPLFNSVWSKWKHVYENGSLKIADKDALIEVYYQLKQMGYEDLSGDLLRRSVIYFYKMTSGSIKGYLGNAGQTLGGDSFLLQIKFNAAKTESFNLIDFNYLNNGLTSLINTFSQTLDVKQLMKNLSKQFIYPDIPEIRKNANDFSKKYANLLGEQIEKEKNVLESKIINLFSF